MDFLLNLTRRDGTMESATPRVTTKPKNCFHSKIYDDSSSVVVTVSSTKFLSLKHKKSEISLIFYDWIRGQYIT